MQDLLDWTLAHQWIMNMLGFLNLLVFAPWAFCIGYQRGKTAGAHAAFMVCEECGGAYTQGHYKQHMIISPDHPNGTTLALELEALRARRSSSTE